MILPNILYEIGAQRFMDQQKSKGMTKEAKIGTIVRILKTKRDLDFLLKLAPKELEILIACLRDWMDQDRK